MESGISGKKMMDDDIRADISEIRSDIAEIKADLKHHVRRTDELQDMVKPLSELSSEIRGAINTVKYAAGIALFAIAVAEFLHWKL
jgi:uncharacterized coiled-coil DUF342 family protein